MPDTTDRPLRVFLCHASDDKNAARDLYQRLRSHGFDPWLDEEKILPGQNWQREIRKAVRDADAVIVFLSHNSITKDGYVQKEVRFALDVADEKPEGAIYLIPARLDDCEVPERLSDWQWVDLHREGGFDRLLRSLNHRAGKSDRVRSSRPGTTGTPDRAEVLKPIFSLLSPDSRRIPVYKAGRLKFVKVPAGEFIMGSGENDKQAKDNEKPRHVLNIPYDYWISRFPVTNAQYNEFVQAHGKRHPVENWQKKPNHPVVFVTWYDALAYSHWMTEKIWHETSRDFIIRLPTEAEWGKAACGGVAMSNASSGNEAGGAHGSNRIYPWGDQWDESKCNSLESGIGRTTPVGQYSPAGDSPYGCADMAGNVWEWTGSIFKPYPYDPGDGREDLSASNEVHRVVRGGSFGVNHRGVRCAARYGYSPRRKGRFYGFRVVLSPASRG